MLHEGVEGGGGRLVDLSVLGGEVGGDLADGEGSDLVEVFAKDGRQFDQHLQREQVHLRVGIAQARHETVENLQKHRKTLIPVHTVA